VKQTIKTTQLSLTLSLVYNVTITYELELLHLTSMQYWHQTILASGRSTSFASCLVGCW